jgi:hypothetical protein
MHSAQNIDRRMARLANMHVRGKYLQRIRTPNIVDADEERFATTHLGAKETVEGLGTMLK